MTQEQLADFYLWLGIGDFVFAAIIYYIAVKQGYKWGKEDAKCNRKHKKCQSH